MHNPIQGEFDFLVARHQIGLVDVSSPSPFNDGSRYLLTCYMFSKLAWALLVRRKTGQNVAKAFEKIQADEKCNKSSEFLNSTFQIMLHRHRIKFYASENEYLKAAVVESFNRTLKTKMFRNFTHANTSRYLDVLDDLRS